MYDYPSGGGSVAQKDEKSEVQVRTSGLEGMKIEQISNLEVEKYQKV